MHRNACTHFNLMKSHRNCNNNNLTKRKNSRNKKKRNKNNETNEKNTLFPLFLFVSFRLNGFGKFSAPLYVQIKLMIRFSHIIYYLNFFAISLTFDKCVNMAILTRVFFLYLCLLFNLIVSFFVTWAVTY